MAFTIELTDEQEQKFDDWCDSFEDEYLGVNGGHYSIEVVITSIGYLIFGKRYTGEKIDLTDYENF